jgi:hypothetical protein
MRPLTGSIPSVLIGDRRFAYQKPWDGRPLTDRGYFAFDRRCCTKGFGGTVNFGILG